jgi:hypothetical protein
MSQTSWPLMFRPLRLLMTLHAASGSDIWTSALPGVNVIIYTIVGDFLRFQGKNGRLVCKSMLFTTQVRKKNFENKNFESMDHVYDSIGAEPSFTYVRYSRLCMYKVDFNLGLLSKKLKAQWPVVNLTNRG